MSENNVETAVAYYTAMGKKDIAGMEKCLHPDVEFKGPFAEITGRDVVLNAVKGLVAFFETLTIRAKFSSETQGMFVYDLVFPGPIGTLSVAALLTFRDGLISKMELIFDSCRISQKKDEIFS